MCDTGLDTCTSISQKRWYVAGAGYGQGPNQFSDGNIQFCLISVSGSLEGLSSHTASKCSDLDCRNDPAGPQDVLQMSQPESGGTEWFHSISDAKSHIKYSTVQGTYPGKHDIFLKKVPS